MTKKMLVGGRGTVSSESLIVSERKVSANGGAAESEEREK